MKKILFLILIIILIFMIYVFTVDNKIYYLALGDDITLGRTNQELYLNNFPNIYINNLIQNNNYEIGITSFANLNYRTTDLLNDIISNKKILINKKQITIRNAIIKADITTISIGLNDYINYIENYQLLDSNLMKLKNDMNILLKEIRKISKEKIILIGIYNPKPEDIKLKEILNELNFMYKNVAKENKIDYLDIYSRLSEKKYITNLFPNIMGYDLVTSYLIRYIEDDII